MRRALRIPYSLPVVSSEEAGALGKKLVLRGDDHAKAIRFCKVWLEVQAPRYWWAEMDTYRVGVEKVSESTMHTLVRNRLTQENFASPIPAGTLNRLNSFIRRKDRLALKKELPEGFLQTRIVELDYQTLRRIWLQRRNHDLPEWREFLGQIEAMLLPFADDFVFFDEEL